MNNYIVYHLHTEDSISNGFVDSCTNYKLYIDKAKQLGQTSICFTEHHNIFNWYEKKMYCDEQGIKYMHGIECYLTEKLNPDQQIRDNYHTILIAKNAEGFKELNRLYFNSTDPSHFYYKNRITFDEFFNISDNIIKISACLASPLQQYKNKIMSLRNEGIDVTKEMATYIKLCNTYDYYEIQYHNCPEQIEYNQYLYKLSKKYNKPLIMGTDTHSLDKYKAECRTILQYGKDIVFQNEDEFDLTYKSYDELIEMCHNQNALENDIYIKAINNTNIMANSVEPLIIDTTVKYPILYKGQDEEQILWDTLKRKYADKVKNNIIKDDKRYMENIKEEMRVFHKINMSGFMLFMSELMTWCRENNIPTSPCRGSVGGSTVAYISDITDVDPILRNTVFSRFANEDREEVGDIDVDIYKPQRPKVYNYIVNRFGQENTGFILAMTTVADKGVIDLIGKAFRKIAEINNCDTIYTLTKIKEIKAEFDISPDMVKEKYPDLFYYYDGLVNTVVAQSQHPAGIVAAPLNLIDNYGMFRGKDGQYILPINMEEVHEVGLVKYDILGLKNIGIIDNTCKYAGIKYPLSHEIDWNDQKVYKEMLSNAVGIFQFEEDYAFSMLKKFNTHSIDDMSLVNASIRPSGASYRDDLIDHKIHKNPSKLIDELLKDNLGYLCIEENQMISTDKGLVPIKDIKVKDKVYTTNGLETVSKVMFNGHKDVYSLITKYGNIICTDNHKILTEHGWKEYKDIGIGDNIAMYVGTDSTIDYNKDILKFIGWYLGDGYCSGNNVQFINSNLDVVTDFKKTIESIWEELDVSIKNIKSRVNKLDLYRCNIIWKNKSYKKDKPVHQILKENNLYRVKANKKSVPNFIFKLNRECLLHFLGAYTDTDSCLKNNVINYKTSSKQLCEDIREILRLIGYVSTVQVYNEGYNICVKGGSELLKELCDYSIKARVNYVPSNRIYQRQGSISTDIVKKWLIDNHILLKKVQQDLCNTIYKSNTTNVSIVIKIADYYGLTLPVYVTPNIVYSPVLEKSYQGEKNVYDLEINNTHNFVANGIVVHNCYQEDTIKFLKDICGLTGSEADNVRRAIGRKQLDRLQKALPQILDGYCKMSPQPREIAEQEAKEFLQIIEDSSNYQFGYNHSTGYSMLGYLCAYMRCYYPLEFCTAYLNCSETPTDIQQGTQLAIDKGFSIYSPKFRKSKGEFFMDKSNNAIYKGVGSIKGFNKDVADKLYDLRDKEFETFYDLMILFKEIGLNKSQLDILIKIDYFAEFGDINYLLMYTDIYNKYGKRKTIPKPLPIDIDLTGCFGKETAKQYSQIDNRAVVNRFMDYMVNIPKITIYDKMKYQNEFLGYTDMTLDCEPNIFMVQGLDINRYGTPFVTLYRCCDSKVTQYKVDKKEFVESPFNINDVIKCGFKGKEKMRKVDDKFIRTGEFESVLTVWNNMGEDENNA